MKYGIYASRLYESYIINLVLFIIRGSIFYLQMIFSPVIGKIPYINGLYGNAGNIFLDSLLQVTYYQCSVHYEKGSRFL